MLLYIDRGDELTNEWKRVSVLESELNLSHNGHSVAWDSEVVLPSGTTLKIGGVYEPATLSANIVVMHEGRQLISIFGNKSTPKSYGPTILFKAPCGTDVQLMVGKNDL